MRKKEHGISIPLTLVLLTIIIIIAFSVAAQGNWNSCFVRLHTYDKEAFYAAETGISESLLKYKHGDTDWNQGLGTASRPVSLVDGISYYVEVTNNQEGISAITSPQGVSVPPGLAYFEGTGMSNDGKVIKKVGVMVKGSTLGKFDYALAADGIIDLKAGSSIYGNVKSNSDIVFNAATKIIPVHAEGNVYACGTVTAAAMVDMSNDQFVRARKTITGDNKIKNATLVEYDTTYHTLPFNTSQQTVMTTNPEVDGENLPYPDYSTLLTPGSYTLHNETNVSGNFDLGLGGLHYFPNGVTFQSGTNFTGTGTIIVGNNNPLTFNTPIGSNKDHYMMNIVVMDGPNKTGPGADLTFKNAAFIRGFMYCYGKIETQASLDVQGTVISYKGQMVQSGASTGFAIYPVPVYTPGFEAWLGDGSGASVVNVVSWQKY